MAFDHFKQQDYKSTEVHGVVVNNVDPMKARRLQIRVSPIHDGVPDAALPWAVCGVSAGRGPTLAAASVAIPMIGADVLVKFQQGDPQNPIYTGAISSSGTVPELFRINYPNRSGRILPNGTYMYVDEVTNDMMIHHRATTLLIAASGRTTVNIAENASVNVVGETLLKTPKLTVDCPQSLFTGIVQINGQLRPMAGVVGSGDVDMDGFTLKKHKHPTAPSGPVSAGIP